ARTVQAGVGPLELAEVSQRPLQPRGRRDVRGGAGHRGAAATDLRVQRREIVLEDLNGRLVLALRVVAVTEIAARERGQRGIAAPLGDAEAARAVLDRPRGPPEQVVLVHEAGISASHPLRGYDRLPQ